MFALRWQPWRRAGDRAAVSAAAGVTGVTGALLDGPKSFSIQRECPQAWPSQDTTSAFLTDGKPIPFQLIFPPQNKLFLSPLGTLEVAPLISAWFLSLTAPLEPNLKRGEFPVVAVFLQRMSHVAQPGN